MSMRRTHAPAASAAGPATAVSHKARLEASLRSITAPAKNVSVAFSDYRKVLQWAQEKAEFKGMEWNRLYLLKATLAKIDDKFGGNGGMSPDKVNAMTVEYMDLDDVLTFTSQAYNDELVVQRIKEAFRSEGALRDEEQKAALYLSKARRQKIEDDEPVMKTCKSGGKCNIDVMSTRGLQREQNGGKHYDDMFPPGDIKQAEALVLRGKYRRAAPEGGLWGLEMT